MLKDFPKADEGWVEDVVQGCADGAPLLASGDDGGFMNKVALRAAPQREKPAKPAQEKAPKTKAEEKPEPASPFAKLKGLFSG